MPEFSPEIVRCRWLGGATGPSVGARFAAVNKVPGRPSWTNKPVVTVAEPGRAFAFARTERFAGTVLWSYRFEPEAEGTRFTESYEVTHQISPIGWFNTSTLSAARTTAQTCGQGWNKRFSAYATWPSALTACHPMVAAVSERGRSVMPVLFAVATDPGLHRALGDVLRERYGGSYSVVVASEPADAIGQLAAFRDSGEQVALLLAPFRMAELDGIDFLVRAHDLHPGARRIVIVDVGDVGAAAELRRALTLNQIDSYFGQPWASPEEELHPVIGETLRRWARDPSASL